MSEPIVKTRDIVRRCAEQTGFTDKKCAEVLDHVFSVIGRKLGEGGPVYIEDFGTFGPVTKSRPNFTYKMGGWYPFRWFRAVGAALEKISGEPGPDPEPVPEGPSVERPNILPVGVLREEDAIVIQRWLEDRSRPVAVESAVSLLWADPRQRRVWAEETLIQAKNLLRHFARRSPTPLLSVGLTGMATPHGDPLRAEVALYAADYHERISPRLAERLPAQYQAHPDLIWRTTVWVNFTHFAKDFYRWCEYKGLRPPGTNPVEGIKIKSAYNKGDGSFSPVIVVLAWYRQILRYIQDHPEYKPRDRAMIFLLANGLRRTEVARIRIENIDLKEGRLLVVGKGSMLRNVYLLPWTRKAINSWLEARAISKVAMSPWLFPSRAKRGHVARLAVWSAVVRAATHVFHKPEQKRIREGGITPHGFRYFYNSERLNRGTPELMLRKDIGHRSPIMTARYYRTDDESMRKDVERVSRKPWF